jgi:hypothetical protein
MAVGTITDTKSLKLEEEKKALAFDERMPALSLFSPDLDCRLLAIKREVTASFKAEHISRALKDRNLLFSVMNQDIEEVVSLISEKRVDDECLHKALIEAVKVANIEIVDLFLDHREFAQTFLVKAIFEAIELDYLPMVEFFLEKRPFLEDSMIKMILKSIALGKSEIFSFLIGRCSLPTRAFGQAVLLALEKNQQLIAEKLLSMGDLSCEDRIKALKKSARMEATGFFRFFIERGPYEQIDLDEAFLEAIDYKNVPIIDFFLEHELVSVRVKLLSLNSLIKSNSLKEIKKIMTYFPFSMEELGFSIQLADHLRYFDVSIYLKYNK